MSRLKDALMALLGKCTPEGAHPSGNNVDEIIECIARHYNGQRFVINLSWDASANLISDKGFSEVYEAFSAGHSVFGKASDGMIWQVVSVTNAGVHLFSTTKFTANSITYTIAILPSKAGEKCTLQNITVGG